MLYVLLFYFTLYTLTTGRHIGAQGCENQKSMGSAPTRKTDFDVIQKKNNVFRVINVTHVFRVLTVI